MSQGLICHKVRYAICHKVRVMVGLGLRPRWKHIGPCYIGHVTPRTVLTQWDPSVTYRAWCISASWHNGHVIQIGSYPTSLRLSYSWLDIKASPSFISFRAPTKNGQLSVSFRGCGGASCWREVKGWREVNRKSKLLVWVELYYKRARQKRFTRGLIRTALVSTFTWTPSFPAKAMRSDLFPIRCGNRIGCVVMRSTFCAVSVWRRIPISAKMVRGQREQLDPQICTNFSNWGSN